MSNRIHAEATSQKRQDEARREAEGREAITATTENFLCGNYRILAQLGAGATATTYLAEHLVSGRDVALKLLNESVCAEPSARGRFMREGHASGVLKSPHTAQLLEFGETENRQLFLVFELIAGESVRARVERLGRLPAKAAVEACLQALRSLGEAHGKGVIHRDIKPEHLVYAPTQGSNEEILKVLDFGIAKIAGEGWQHLGTHETSEGHILGTPRYMSPEQVRRQPLDGRSDLYSLGVVLYEMLTGRPPFVHDDPIVTMSAHITTTPLRPSEVCDETHIPIAIEEIVMRVLSKSPDDRPSSAEAMHDELETALEDVKELAATLMDDAFIADFPRADPGKANTSLRRRRSWFRPMALVAATILLSGVGLAAVRSRGHDSRVVAPYSAGAGATASDRSAPRVAPSTPSALPDCTTCSFVVSVDSLPAAPASAVIVSPPALASAVVVSPPSAQPRLVDGLSPLVVPSRPAATASSAPVPARAKPTRSVTRRPSKRTEWAHDSDAIE